MDFTQFLQLREETSLVIILISILLFDLFMGTKSRKFLPLVSCLLIGLHTVVCALLLWLSPESREAFGGMYNVSSAAIALKTVLNIGVLLISLQTYSFLCKDEQKLKSGEFYFLLLSTLLGMDFMISSGHFLLFFLGLETASIPLATLIAFNKFEQRSAEAGAKFILTTAFASGISFFGLSLIYGGTGSLYFSDIASLLYQSPLLWAGMILLSTGLFFKISLVPFHLWTADVYQGAPTPVSAYLSVISKGAGVFGLFLIFSKVFAPFTSTWQTALFVLIILSITIGNLFAIRQKNMKRFLAFSSISQAGYIVLGIIAANTAGLSALLYYIFVYVLSNIAAFGVIHVIEQASGKQSMDDYNSLYKTNPKLSVVMTFALFSLAGIPPFAGFFSKFFVFAAVASSGFYVLLFIALLNTVISLYYYLLVIKAMFINKNDEPIATFRSDNPNKAVLIFCTIGILISGLASCIYMYFDKLAALL